LIFFGGIALLSRARSGPGGPNDFMNSPMNPMNIGKSKAKVQMVPDTGVKFD
jgi:cell division protease FtsH